MNFYRKLKSIAGSFERGSYEFIAIYLYNDIDL